MLLLGTKNESQALRIYENPTSVIDRKQLIAIGDSANDLAMLAIDGLGRGIYILGHPNLLEL